MAEIVIPKKYACFANATEIYALCEPLFCNSPVDMFCYSRVYENGFDFSLDTYTKFQEYLLREKKGKNHVDFKALNIGANSSCFVRNKGNKNAWLVSEVWSSVYWMNMFRGFNIESLLCVFEKITDYYELFFFGSCTGKNIFNFYINHYDVLEKFMLYFVVRGAKLIETAEKSKIFLPYRDIEYVRGIQNLQKKVTGEKCRISKLCSNLKLKRYPIQHKNINTYVTSRELECLRGIAQGCTVKEVGNNLQISPRTIETHLQRVRSRLDVTSSNRLLDIYRSSSLVDLY